MPGLGGEEGRKDLVADVSADAWAMIGEGDRAEVAVAAKLHAQFAAARHRVGAID